MTDTFATVRNTAQRLEEMVRKAAGGYHDDLYVRVLGDQGRVQTLAQSDGNRLMSYCTFQKFDAVDGDAEAVLPTGLDKDTKGYLDYLSIAQGSGKMEMEFAGVEGDGEHPRLADYWGAEGALNTRIRLPASAEDLKHVPWGMTDRFTADQEFVSSAALDDEGNIAADDLESHVPPTVIETTASTIRNQIIEPGDFMDLNYRPIIVEDGELKVHLEGNAGDDSIDGTVNAESVTGPDVSRRFDESYFDAVFGSVDGYVRLALAPHDGEGPASPLVVVKDDLAGRTVRHVIGPFQEE